MSKGRIPSIGTVDEAGEEALDGTNGTVVEVLEGCLVVVEQGRERGDADGPIGAFVDEDRGINVAGIVGITGIADVVDDDGPLPGQRGRPCPRQRRGGDDREHLHGNAENNPDPSMIDAHDSP